MKPSYLTGEFWLSVVAMVVGAIMASGILAAPGVPAIAIQIVGIVATVLSGLGYTVARGNLKATEIKAQAVNPTASIPGQGQVTTIVNQ